MKKIFILTMLFFLNACASHVWEYEPEAKQKYPPIKQAVLMVQPLTDERPTSHFMEWSAPLALLPFVPYSKTRVVNHPDKSFVGFAGNPAEKLAEAVADELTAHSLFSTVIYNNPSQKSDYILSGKLKKFRVKSYWSFYGASLAGIALWYLGAPAEKIYNDVCIEFTLSDKNNKVYFQKEYTASSSRLLGFYYNQNKLQFEEAVKQINLQLVNDLLPIIKKIQ